MTTHPSLKSQFCPKWEVSIKGVGGRLIPEDFMQSRYAPRMLRKLCLQRSLKLRQQALFYKLRGLSTPFADLGSVIRRGLKEANT